ncbi:MAG TPA: hypothetical protein VFT20_13905 [Candidatus Limnocylindrales bacterium]|nr:hypothetical protein [Candidatus Limnocylindrales bacterium]
MSLHRSGWIAMATIGPPIDRRSGARALALVAATALLAACAQGGGASPSSAATAGASGAGTGTAVAVTLEEWAVSTDASSAPAGPVTFTATNEGPADPHEFVVIKTDLDFTALPTDAQGVVDEAGGEMEVIGEIEDIAVGASEDLTVTLEPGKYALICNIYDEAEQEAHYSEGMRTTFTVN